MNDSFRKLTTISSQALIKSKPSSSQEIISLSGNLFRELHELLQIKNGFYAFESALHVFPSADSTLCKTMSLEAWNEQHLWRNEYGNLVEGCLFFAEDIFGCQFCLHANQVCIFEPETGGLENLCSSIYEWAAQILQDYEVLTGFPLAHQWQKKNGKLSFGKRLLPKIPFVAGGEFNIENLYELDSVQGMRFRGSLAKQISGFPDGTRFIAVDS